MIHTPLFTPQTKEPQCFPQSCSHMCSQLKYGTTMLLVTSKGAAGDTSCLESSCNNLKEGRGRSHLLTVRRGAPPFHSRIIFDTVKSSG